MAAPISRLLYKKYWTVLEGLTDEDIMILKTLCTVPDRAHLAVQRPGAAWSALDQAGLGGYNQHLGLPGRPIVAAGAQVLESLRQRAKLLRGRDGQTGSWTNNQSISSASVTPMPAPVPMPMPVTDPGPPSRESTSTPVPAPTTKAPTPQTARGVAPQESPLPPKEKKTSRDIAFAIVPSSLRWISPILKMKVKRGEIYLESVPQDVASPVTLRLYFNDQFFEFAGTFQHPSVFVFDPLRQKAMIDAFVTAYENSRLQRKSSKPQ